MCHGEALRHHGPTLSSELSRHPGPNDLSDPEGGRPLLKTVIAQVAAQMAWHYQQAAIATHHTSFLRHRSHCDTVDESVP